MFVSTARLSSSEVAQRLSSVTIWYTGKEKMDIKMIQYKLMGKGIYIYDVSPLDVYLTLVDVFVCASTYM